MITSQSTLVDISFGVCTALDRLETIAVLTGGSAATYYAPHRYQSRDADFVIVISADANAAGAALRDLGFNENGGIYSHPANLYTVEFPPGPLAIGTEIIQGYDTVHRNDEVLYILTRTDSVCDRLAGFYHWSDRSALRTALDVALSGPIDIERIERWSVGERSLEKYDEFRERFARESSLAGGSKSGVAKNGK
ncbi:MAG: hypothetical protein ABI182_00860 [Candidatus Baltobacteraceae bacterium]